MSFVWTGRSTSRLRLLEARALTNITALERESYGQTTAGSEGKEKSVGALDVRMKSEGLSFGV